MRYWAMPADEVLPSNSGAPAAVSGGGRLGRKEADLEAGDVIALDCLLRGAGIQLWLDGGWAVDALLGRQTRPHADMDIVIQTQDMALTRAVLAAAGFADVPRDDTCDWNFVLGDASGRQVDVHVIWFDQTGAGVYGPIGDGLVYPAGCLAGQGSIDGEPVPCVTAEVLVAFHTGYAFDADDMRDVVALCSHFGLPLPPEYAAAIGDASPPPGNANGTLMER